MQDKDSYGKSIVFLYTGNMQLNFEFRNITPLILAPKVMKYLGINLTEYVQDPQNKDLGFRTGIQNFVDDNNKTLI